MKFYLEHPDYPAYGFELLVSNTALEKAVNRLGPMELVSSAFDWPEKTYRYRGWTDTINSLWWPHDGDDFASCVILLDDERAAKVKFGIQAQIDATLAGVSPRPHFILSAILQGTPSPGDANTLIAYPAETYPAAGFNPAPSSTVDTELMAWKLYPLPLIKVSEHSDDPTFGGLWFLPLVDLRYFWRATALLPLSGGSATSQSGTPWPLLTIDHRATPDWMPLLRGYPQDLSEPASFEAIVDNGTHPAIEGHAIRGWSSDQQAAMEGWRIVNRDVRSNFNAEVGNPQHDQFTQILSDYPDDDASSGYSVGSYHDDAIRLANYGGNRVGGGKCDTTNQNDLVPSKIAVFFQVNDTQTYYQITIEKAILDPLTVDDLIEDTTGLGIGERLYCPKAFLGVKAHSNHPDTYEHATLLAAAKQWCILYYRWRRKQLYYKYPRIAPVIPNGYAHMIRWDFQSDKYETTYIAMEGILGTDDRFGGAGGGTGSQEWFWAKITKKTFITGEFTKYDWFQVVDNDDPTPITWETGGLSGSADDHPAYEVNNIDLPVNDGSTGSGSGGAGEPLIVQMWPGEGDYYLFNMVPRWEFVSQTGAIDPDTGQAPATLIRWDQDIKDWVDVEECLIIDANA